MIMRMMIMLVVIEVFGECLLCAKQHFSHFTDKKSEGWEGK